MTIDKIARSILKVNELGQGEPKSKETAAEIAYAIVEIVRSARKISGELLEALEKDATPYEHWEALADFREELRHIAFHISDCDYFSVVLGTVGPFAGEDKKDGD